MIGKLKGKLLEIDGNKGLIETLTGISFVTYLTSHLIARYKPLDTIEVYTYLQVRDDALVLFGFEKKEEYQFFIMLLSVSGVGPKTAYHVISNSSVDILTEAIKANDVNVLMRVPGLGKKTAMKIILELSQKLKEGFMFEKMYLSEDDKTFVDALVSLGFSSQEVKKVLPKIDKTFSIEQKVKEGLKLLTH